ncbi:MAG: hypothetical protein PSV43_03765, partial [Prosthecobacter sp.]
MSLSHTLLTLTAAGGLWWGGHALSCSRTALHATATPPAFALPGSAYGSLAARLIRDSLYSYWHGGESAAPAASSQSSTGAPPPPPPGRFSRRGMPAPVPAAQTPSETSWLQARVDELSRLEKSRTRRVSTVPLSNAHQQFLYAAADVRLRFAYQLDPGDATLYEILHFHIASRTQSPEAARAAIDALGQSAMAYGLREGGSLSDALTGAGAAINLLNDQLQPGNARRDDKAVSREWHALEECLERYRRLRSSAELEGWWDGVPEVRREEIEAHAKLLKR